MTGSTREGWERAREALTGFDPAGWSPRDEFGLIEDGRGNVLFGDEDVEDGAAHSPDLPVWNVVMAAWPGDDTPDDLPCLGRIPRTGDGFDRDVAAAAGTLLERVGAELARA